MVSLLTVVFGRPPENWGTGRQKYWNVPFLRNPYFTGRERVLHHLHQALAAEQTVALSQTRVISGLGGIGKTQTAIEYAYRYADEYEAVLWVRSESHESLVSDFAALASTLELREKDEADQFHVLVAVKRWMQVHGPWLLILDNADDLALVSNFLPRRAGGAILLTTRSQIPGLHIKKIELNQMSREEGVTFLLRRSGFNEDEDGEKNLSAIVSDAERRAAEELWELTDGLPLALDQAGAYVAARQCSLANYLHLYRNHRHILLQERGGLIPEHPDAVATTWSISFGRIEQKNPFATELLRLSVFLSPDAIPEEVIIRGAAHLGSQLQAVATSRLLLDNAISTLREYSLLRRDPATSMLSIHRLVQAVLQDTMTEQEREQWTERAIAALDACFPEATRDALDEVWRQCERLLPHVLICAAAMAPQKRSLALASLLYKTAGYLRARAQYEQATPFFQQALQIREQVLGPVHADVAYPLDGLAILYAEQGKYEQAEPLYQRALHIWEQALGFEHPDVAYPLDGLANLYRDQGKYVEAEPLYQRALHIREQKLGPEHPTTAETIHDLARYWEAQDNGEEARVWYARALAVREQVLGVHHPKTTETRTRLIALLNELGQHEEAARLEVAQSEQKTYTEE
jgi:tetratricopeptide (TPR) repeat protein